MKKQAKTSVAKTLESEPKEHILVRALRVEILKPVGFSWDELGKILRERRAVAHRTMNAALIAVHVAAKTSAKEKPLQTVAYQAAGAELDSYREWARTHKDERVRAMAELHIPAGMQSAWATHAYAEWRKFAKSNGEDGFPAHRRGQPIMIRRGSNPKSREWGLTLDDEGRLVLHANLDSTHDHMVGHRRLAIRPGKGAQYGLLRELAAGEGTAKLLDLKLIFDERARRKDGTKGKWYGIIAYSRPIPPKPDGLDPKKTLIVHRGGYNAITVMGTDGFWAKLVSGKKLMTQKKRLTERRRSIQDALKRAEIGHGARGHGRKRRLKPLTDIEDKEGRVIHTFCQTTAAEIRKLCLQRGYGSVVIGAYGGVDAHDDRNIRRFVPRFPLHQMKQCIVTALEPVAVNLVECDESYISMDCPDCEHRDPKSHGPRGIFHCTNPQCGLDREVDWVSTLHMLHRSGADRTEWDRRAVARKKMIGQIAETRDGPDDGGAKTE